jgi:hypothetical protein
MNFDELMDAFPNLKPESKELRRWLNAAAEWMQDAEEDIDILTAQVADLQDQVYDLEQWM